MKKRLFSVGYMFLLTLLCTSVVSAVKVANEERIRINEEVKLKAVVLDVLDISLPEGPARGQAVSEAYNSRVHTRQIKGRTLYVGSDVGGRVTAYAFRAGGPGFWGPIEAMVGVSAAADEIRGVNFYRNVETPGLGARMTEDWFREQFRGLSLLRADREGRFFRLLQPGSSSGPGELDAITGATETSRAIERFLNGEIDLFLNALASGAEDKE